MDDLAAQADVLDLWSETVNPDIDPRWYPPCCEWENYIGTTDDGTVLFPDVCECICHTPDDDFWGEG